MSNRTREGAAAQTERHGNGPLPGRAKLGPGSANLKILAETLDLSIGQRGDEFILTESHPAKQALAKKALTALAVMPVLSETPSQWEVECLANLLKARPDLDPVEFFSGYAPRLGPDRLVVPKTLAQRLYLETMSRHDLVFGLGPAGTGKTYLAVAMAVEALYDNRVSRLILTRPAVEAGERLGFLPGDLADKIDPYLRPLYDALSELIPAEKLVRMYERRQIEVAPLAFMRGRTLSGAFVILDEAQNTTTEQMKMFLTRLGPGARAVVTGDPEQSDLPGGRPVGLLEATEILQGIEGIAFCHFKGQDVVRHRLVRHILAAYERKAAKGRAGEGSP
ncbi:MAG: PhoH family protein [Deltaproteobacteria bacterium]|nr:PhoH family protein [Deltaproteobacteria bacterium]